MSGVGGLFAVGVGDAAFARLAAAVGDGAIARIARVADIDAGGCERADALIFELDGAPAGLLERVRDVRAGAPHAQLVAMGGAVDVARLRQQLLLVGGLDDRWSFLKADQAPGWGATLAEAAARAQRRRALQGEAQPARGPAAGAAASALPALPIGQLLGHMREAVLYLDLRGRIVFCNPAAARLYGMEPEALRGTSMDERVAPGDRDRHAALLAEAGHGGDGGVAELAHLAADGGAIAVEVSLSVMKDWRGQQAGVLLLVRDLAERRAALRAAVLEVEREAALASAEEMQALNEELAAGQEELARANAQLQRQKELVEAEVAARTAELARSERRLLDAQSLAQLGHWEWDVATGELAWSDELYRIFGVARDGSAMTFARFQATVHPDDAAIVPAAIEPLLARGGPFAYELRVVRPDGAVRWVFTRGEVVVGPDRPAGLIMGVCQDITERKLQDAAIADRNRRLEQADRAKDEFLSVISHELRTPLNFITGFASILEDEVQGPLNAAQHGSVAKILAGSERMLVLVDDLLDFARMQAGTFWVDRAPVAYAPLVEEVASSMRLLAGARGLALRVEDGFAGQACVDAQRVVQVLTNLVANAVKFTDAGEVLIRTRVDGDRLLTEVRDTGHGIAAEDLPRLFQRFKQLDMSKTRRAGGTGLGLAISKGIVEAHGGEIGAASEPGRGSTFWFALPLAGT